MNQVINENLLISSSAKKSIRESAILAQNLGLGLEISRIPLCKNEGMSVDDTILFFSMTAKTSADRPRDYPSPAV